MNWENIEKITYRLYELRLVTFIVIFQCMQIWKMELSFLKQTIEHTIYCIKGLVLWEIWDRFFSLTYERYLNVAMWRGFFLFVFICSFNVFLHSFKDIPFLHLFAYTFSHRTAKHICSEAWHGIITFKWIQYY